MGIDMICKSAGWETSSSHQDDEEHKMNFEDVPAGSLSWGDARKMIRFVDKRFENVTTNSLAAIDATRSQSVVNV